MRLLLVGLFLAAPLIPQRPDLEDRDRPKESVVRLPNGKNQQDEILRAEHEKQVQDVAQLIRLAEQLQDELLKNDRHVLSLASLKKADEIEKLAKRIRTRMKR